MNLTEGVPEVGALELLQGSLVMQMADHLHILATAAAGAHHGVVNMSVQRFNECERMGKRDTAAPAIM